MGQRHSRQRINDRTRRAPAVCQPPPLNAVSRPTPCSEATNQQLRQCAAEISELNQKVAEASAEAKKRSDPIYFREQQKLAFQLFLSNLNQLTFVDPLPETLKRAWNVMIIGAVSAGKSSLLNKLYGLTLPVGVGDVTAKIAHVHTDGDLVVWDSPGSNKDWALYDPDTLSFVAAMSRVVIVYRDSLLPLDNIVCVVHRIKGSAGMICVRTQCDLFTVAGHRQALTLDQELQRDKEALAAMGTRSDGHHRCPALQDGDRRSERVRLQRAEGRDDPRWRPLASCP